MDKRILRWIKKDLEKSFDFNNLVDDVFAMHFGVCQYIRNKYLWGYPKNVKKLQKIFDTNDIDTLSNQIWHKIKEDYQSSKPKI